MSKIAMFVDFDLTMTEEYQQIPLITEYLDKYQKYYNNPEILKKFRKFDENFHFDQPLDFFEILKIKRQIVVDSISDARIQNGVTWLHQLIDDKKPGMPLEDLTLSSLYEIGKKIKLSTDVLECFNEIKKIWKKNGIDIYVYIISVGLKTLIQGAIDGELERKNIENPIDGIFSGELVEEDNTFKIISVIEDYSKTEIAYELTKGGKNNRDKKILPSEYVIPHNKFVVLGDGFSDVPIFRFFRKKGSQCVMVYKKGCIKSFEKVMFDAFKNVDYLLERCYTPNNKNPTWKYLNEAIKKIAYKECLHSEISIYNYKWSKSMSESEKSEIQEHFENCDFHDYGYNLTYVIPKI